MHQQDSALRFALPVLSLTWDVISHVLYVHFMQPNLSRSIFHCYCAIFVIYDIWCIHLSRGHVYFTYKRPPWELQEKLPVSPLPPTENCPATLNEHFNLLNSLPTGTNKRLMGNTNQTCFLLKLHEYKAVVDIWQTVLRPYKLHRQGCLLQPQSFSQQAT